MKRKNRDTAGRRIAQAIIAEYKLQSVTEMKTALKEVFGPMFEAMLKGEMESYLGYEHNFFQGQCQEFCVIRNVDLTLFFQIKLFREP